MPDVGLSKITKSYAAGQLAVKDLNLAVPDGSFTCLLGPSGCGKTTTLRMIAGLEHPTSGEIRVGERVVDSVQEGRFVPVEKRDMGLVFQSYALWPHLTVTKNIDFGLRMKKVRAAERSARVGEALRLMQIESLASRYPSQLSGGQQQRVALARMLAVNPNVLLLDEPLSNLDAQLRLEMRSELKRIHNNTGQTFVFVTHDQIEAMTMATDIAVMNDGVLEQIGDPMEVYRQPATRFVAEFVGSPPMNILTFDETAPIIKDLWSSLARAGVAVDELGSVGIRPEALIAAAPNSAREQQWQFPATLVTAEPTGPNWILSLKAANHSIYMLTSKDPSIPAGSELTCAVELDDIHLFDAKHLRMNFPSRRSAEHIEEAQ